MLKCSKRGFPLSSIRNPTRAYINHSRLSFTRPSNPIKKFPIVFVSDPMSRQLNIVHFRPATTGCHFVPISLEFSAQIRPVLVLSCVSCSLILNGDPLWKKNNYRRKHAVCYVAFYKLPRAPVPLHGDNQ